MDDFDKGQQAEAFNGMADKGETAKEMAGRLGYAEIVEFLLANGADGKTALEIGKVKGDVNILETLRKASVKPTQKNTP